MKKSISFLLIPALSGLVACGPADKSKEEAPLIEKQTLTLTSDLMTPEVLWAFGRVSGQEVSPDGKTVLYGITYYDIEQNKGNRELYTVGASGEDPKRLTFTPKSEYDAGWRPDGKKIGYLSAQSGSMQLWEINPDGSGAIQITNVENGITGFKYSPDQTRLLYTKEVFLENKFAKLYKGLLKASGRLMDDLLYRHWDTWVDSYSHVFYADYDGTKISNDKDIMPGEPYQSPLKPFGGIEQVCWSIDGKTIAYTCQKMVGKAATLSTNSDIYLYSLETGETRNMTEGMMGFDIAPLYSPDGKYIAWQSMERDGFESDKDRLFILNTQTGEKTYATKNFDQNTGSVCWTPDSKDIYFTSDWHGAFQIYKYTLPSGKISQITTGLQDYATISLAGDKIIAAKQTMSFPTELFTITPEDGAAQQITFTNKELLDQLTMGKVEERWMQTFDNQDMQVFIIYPPHFDPLKKYPAILYCKGGPQGPLSQNFHYRWN
ncbi:MAG: peptidase S9, partial [bacterium]